MINIEPGKKVLVVGASGDLGLCLVNMLSQFNISLGLHCHKRKKPLTDFMAGDHAAKMKVFQHNISSQADSAKLIRSYVKWAKGIDYLVQLSGSITKSTHWQDLSQATWDKDITVNLSGPFFLAQSAMKRMKKKGGKLILVSTASASHGGGSFSLAYGAAKAGIECLTKGLARDGAANNILVNTIAPGFILTDKRKKTPSAQLKKRAAMVPLKRAGKPEDVAGMITYLLSPYGNYITGETITISGGDWL